MKTIKLLIALFSITTSLYAQQTIVGTETSNDNIKSAQAQRLAIKNVTQAADTSSLSPLFKTFSQERLSAEYDQCDWAIGPFKRIDRLTFEKKTQWPDPWKIGWEGRAIHNASLYQKGEKLYMFYRCNPSMESLSARIGLAIFDDAQGWTDNSHNPIIYPTLPNETLGTEDPKIYYCKGRYFLFYEAIYSPTKEDHAKYDDKGYPVGNVGCEINLAISNDLIHWQKKGPILTRSITHLWAKGAVIPKDGAGNAIKINGKYMMFISEGCGGKQVIGYSDDLIKWDFKYQQYLDTKNLGKLLEVDSYVLDTLNSNNLIMDFFYNDGSGISRAGEALFNINEPTNQLALNRGGTLNVGGMIRYKNAWIHAQGWDAQNGAPKIYFYGTKR